MARLVIPRARLFSASVFEPEAVSGGKPRYRCGLILETDNDLWPGIEATLSLAVAGIQAKAGIASEDARHLFVRRGEDEGRRPFPELTGHWLAKATSTEAPTLYDADGVMLDEDDGVSFRPGDLVAAILDLSTAGPGEKIPCGIYATISGLMMLPIEAPEPRSPGYIPESPFTT